MNEVGDTRTRNRLILSERSREGPRATRPGDRPAHRPDTAQSAGESEIWDVAGVSAYLRIPVSSIYKMTAQKAVVRIPHIRIGRTLRFRQVDIDRWLSLLTSSSVEVLEILRHKALKVTHAHHPQTASR